MLFDPGFVQATASSQVPTGWLACDGAAVSRTVYASLFAAIGVAYGAGDGTTTFNVPNLKGKVIVGVDAAQTEFNARGVTGGAKTVTLSVTEMPAHAHGTSSTVDTNHAHNVYARNQDTGWMNQNWSHWHGARVGNGGWIGNTGHGHYNHGGYASEAPEPGNFPFGAVPVNVDSTDTNHYHNFNHDHPSTNYQSESPWAGNWTHTHTIPSQGGGGAHQNLQPYLAMNYLIKT